MGLWPVKIVSKWGPTLIVNIVALSLASYLALVYQSAMTRRLLAEYASPSLVGHAVCQKVSYALDATFA